jgi:hypothetical protein
MSRLLLCAVLGLLAIGPAKGSSLPCSAATAAQSTLRSCVPSAGAYESEIYAKVLPSIPGSTFASDADSSAYTKNQHHWLFGILTVFTVVMASILRMLMSHRIVRFLEELFEPMNWTLTNRGR